MAFEFVEVSHQRRGKSITLDKYGRLMLSTAARKLMNIDVMFSPWVAIAYDKETKCIALQKEELAKNAPADAKTKVDKRGYFNGKSIVDRGNIDLSKAPYHFVFDGEVSVKGERWLSFKMADAKAEKAE